MKIYYEFHAKRHLFTGYFTISRKRLNINKRNKKKLSSMSILILHNLVAILKYDYIDFQSRAKQTKKKEGRKFKSYPKKKGRKIF